jgi:hypothetical protein
VGELLAWLFLHPEESYSVAELARRLAVSESTISREADRLSASSLVVETRRGNMRLLQADLSTPLARPLTELLALTYGPLAVLGSVLSGIVGVEQAYIHGSWAARYKGEAGPPPRDIDVIIVGEADDDDLFDAARAAERTLGREVNVHRVDLERWQTSDDDPFLISVRERPLVMIEIEESHDEVAPGP